MLQVLIVQFGSVAFAVKEGGIEGKYWGLCMVIGAGSFPVQQIINISYFLGKQAFCQNSTTNAQAVETPN